MGWRWMTGWWAGVARSLHRVITKIYRRRDELRSGTLQNLTPTLKDAKFEIIAVPGLGAHPYHTWEAQKTRRASAAEYRTAQSAKVHLLKDLLACDFPDARIWNFAHDSNWLIDAPVKTTAEIGKCLLAEIKAKQSHLPIIFIGHSLGGIIIKQALCNSDSRDIIDDTSGILFLGTPHQGSSVSVAGAMLAWMTGFLGSDTTLLLSLKSNDPQLSNLAATFKQCIASSNKRRQENIRITSFYETMKTHLLGISLGVVVSHNSAVIHDDAGESHGIETDHSGLNKCDGRTDTLYRKLIAAIRHLKAPPLLEQADTWIRDKHYTADRLKIERLSGEPLAMDQCYINLAIVEQPSEDASRVKKERHFAPSPFSILARQKVEIVDKTMQVDLAAIFNERTGSNGQPIYPRRILIRGQAGVGKTTLCKKIVYEFTKGTWGKWNELFERVLWVPLRNLKLPERRGMPKHTFKELLSHEFLLPTNGKNLIGSLSRALDTESSKTLFLLDGLDEVSQDLTGDSSMARFLGKLLDQPTVIITSRPSAKVLLNLDLELETIGFGPDQVKEYIEKSFTNPKTAETDHTKIDNVQSFLQERWLVQGLTRIPIQLDALCYTWEEFNAETMPSTMTGMYNTIVQKLWKKDIIRLEKVKEGYAQDAYAAEVQSRATAEIALIECLAFNGLRNDVIDFTPVHRAGVVKICPLKDLPLDETLSRLSFLRTSGTVGHTKQRNYHFIHLTFQEYFAARYFARQWKDQKSQLPFLTFNSKCAETIASSPIEFLRKHKYIARYDIFWRFVAGLLDEDGHASAFINAIDDEPLDLLGPTHQRLVMHCLSEIPSLPARNKKEQTLAQWLLFECRFTGSTQLASEVEFPEKALLIAFREDSIDMQRVLLRSLANRAHIPPAVINHVVYCLQNEDEGVRIAGIEALGGRTTLPGAALMAVAARLDDKERDVRYAAVEALSRRTDLPDFVLAAMKNQLGQESSEISKAVVDSSGQQLALPDADFAALAGQLEIYDEAMQYAAVEAENGAVFVALVALLEHEDPRTRSAAIESLIQWTFPDWVLAAVVTRLDHEDLQVRVAAGEVLYRRPELPRAVLAVIVSRLDHNDVEIQVAAGEVLRKRRHLPDAVFAAVVARLDHEDVQVRVAASQVLEKRLFLPDAVLAAIVARLDHKDVQVRAEAGGVLCRRAKLPRAVLAAIVARLDHEDQQVRAVASTVLAQRADVPDVILVDVVARLDHDNVDIQTTASGILVQRTTLSNAVVEAVIARLDHEDVPVQVVAIDLLSRRLDLPDSVVEVIAARLDNEDINSQHLAIRFLSRREGLPNAVLVDLVTRLDHEDTYIRYSSEAILRRHKALYCNLLTGPRLAPLYRILLEKSFKEQVSWCIENGRSFINMPDGICHISMAGEQSNVQESINRARPRSFPPIVARDCSAQKHQF